MNSKYDQVIDLLTGDHLKWDTDDIIAVLMKDAVFDANNTRFKQIEGSKVATAPLQGRYVESGGRFMGYPVIFNKVPAGEYQVVICRNDGSGDPQPLVWFDSNADSDPITLDRNGTLIVRPYQDASDIPVSTAGLWLDI